MGHNESKQTRKIFAVTASTGLGETAWSELLREHRPRMPVLEEGMPQSASEEAWEVEPESRIEPESDR